MDCQINRLARGEEKRASLLAFTRGLTNRTTRSGTASSKPPDKIHTKDAHSGRALELPRRLHDYLGLNVLVAKMRNVMHDEVRIDARRYDENDGDN